MYIGVKNLSNSWDIWDTKSMDFVYIICISAIWARKYHVQSNFCEMPKMND